MTTKWDWFVDLLLSAVAGAAIWALSPIMVDTLEPWDAESFYYVVSLSVAGVILGFVRPRRIWMHYLGVFFGQLIYMLLFLPLGPLIVIGVLFLAGYSFLCLAGAAMGLAMRNLVGRFAYEEK